MDLSADFSRMTRKTLSMLSNIRCGWRFILSRLHHLQYLQNVLFMLFRINCTQRGMHIERRFRLQNLIENGLMRLGEFCQRDACSRCKSGTFVLRTHTLAHKWNNSSKIKHKRADLQIKTTIKKLMLSRVIMCYHTVLP